MHSSDKRGESSARFGGSWWWWWHTHTRCQVLPGRESADGRRRSRLNLSSFPRHPLSSLIYIMLVVVVGGWPYRYFCFDFPFAAAAAAALPLEDAPLQTQAMAASAAAASEATNCLDVQWLVKKGGGKS